MSNFIVSAEHAVNVLNEAHKLDPVAIEKIVDSPAFCNKELTEHSTIQCGSMKQIYPNEKEVFTIGLTGLLNGIFGVDENGQGPIARKYTEHGEFAGFCINTNLADDAVPVSDSMQITHKPVMRSG